MKALLTNTQFGHNKEYCIELLESGDSIILRCRWGRIGGTMQRQEKGPFSKEAGLKTFNSLVSKKKSEGYVEEGKKATLGPELETLIPMGALEDEEGVEEKLEDPRYVGELKYDGSHYILKCLNSGDIRLHSRKLSVKDNRPVDKTSNVPHIIKELKKVATRRSLALDGEILCSEEGSSKVTSIMGASPELALERQKEEGYVRFMVFDIPWFDGKPLFSTPFKGRRVILEKFFKDNGPFKHIFLTPQVATGKRAFLKKTFAEGKEGIVLKNLNGLYQPGEKPRDTIIKIKQKRTDDFVVMGFIEGKGKYSDMVGAIVFGQYDQRGKLVEISQCSGFPDEERKKITANRKKYLGRVVEVEFQEWTPISDESPGGSLRHPRWLTWREDKGASECLLKK